METYYVEVREVHVQTVEIEAETPEEAIRLVEEGEGDFHGMEYSHTLESTSWSVTNEEGETVRDQYTEDDPDDLNTFYPEDDDDDN